MSIRYYYKTDDNKFTCFSYDNEFDQSLHTIRKEFNTHETLPNK